MIRLRLAACLLATLGSCPNPAAAQSADFDFYVLALSWSPTWCATTPNSNNAEQCDSGAGHGFVVHGLWPQDEEGYPEFCDTPDRPTRAEISTILDIMPDRGLASHTWRKHGSCSGLDPSDYFDEMRAAFESIRLPKAFEERSGGTISAVEAEKAFVDTNPEMTREGIAIACGDGFFEEVRICLTPTLEFRDCGEVDSRGCRQPRLRLPAPG